MLLSSKGEALTLNEKPLPGVVRSVSVNGKMQAERNARADGGRDFVLKGWEPAEVSIGIALLDGGKQSKQEFLQSLVQLFKKSENGQAVQYELAFPQTRAWGIGRCYFTGLDSNQGSKQMVEASLKFVEFRPEIDQIKQQQDEKAKDSAASPNGTAGPPPQRENMTREEGHKFQEYMAIHGQK